MTFLLRIPFLVVLTHFFFFNYSLVGPILRDFQAIAAPTHSSSMTAKTTLAKLTIAAVLLWGVTTTVQKHLEFSKKSDFELFFGSSLSENEKYLKQQPSEHQQQAQCGVFYFYHVGKCGGTSVNSWMKQTNQENSQSTKYYNWWRQNTKPADFDWHHDLEEMDRVISSKTLSSSQNSTNWMMVHHHHGSPGLRFMMPHLEEWKHDLQAQGCDLILTTVLREPMSRARSVVQYINLPRQKFFSYFENNRFQSQTAYLIFNRGGKERISGLSSKFLPDGKRNLRTTQTEVDEAVSYLEKFNVVGQTSELDDFIAKAKALTGLHQKTETSSSSSHAPVKNKSTASYNITEEMQQAIEPYLETDFELLSRVFPAESRR